MTVDHEDPWGPDPYSDVPPPDEPPWQRPRPLHPVTATDTPVRNSWEPVDLGRVLDGTYESPKPTVGERDDGVGLLYPGKLHTIASEAEGGKTWLALTIVKQELGRGNAAVYLDFEDDEGTIVSRLLAIGAPTDQVRERFAYVRPEESIDSPGIKPGLTALLNRLRPTVVVVDGITEAMALHGMELKDNTDVARFGQMFLHWITGFGPAVVTLDHVVKDPEARGRYAMGGVHKLNGLNGCQYMLYNRTPFSIGKTGRSTVKVSKDRPGQIRRHGVPSGDRMHWVADLILHSESEKLVEVELAPPVENTSEFRPTALMERVAAALEQHGELSQRKVCTAVGGKRDTAIQALNYLILDGYVTEKTPHKLIKEYPDRRAE
jgi:hypothetical protein